MTQGQHQKAPRVSGLVASLERLARLQVRRGGAFLWFGLLSTLVGVLLCTRLGLRTRFEELLPAQSPSVVELRRLLRETEGGGQIFVLLDGATQEERRGAADAIARAVEGAPGVRSASSGVHAAREFLLPRAGLFAGAAELEQLEASLRERLRWELGEALGMNLDDPPEPADLQGAFERVFHAAASESGLAQRFPDGYYEDAAGTASVVVVKTSVPDGDLEPARAVLAQVERRAAAALSRVTHGGIRAHYAGDLVTGLSEYGAAQRDLLDVGALGLALVLGVVLLYFMRLRVLALMLVAISSGLAWTFGITELLVGHVNLASGSLISLVTGSSINHGIIFLGRYYEERRGGRSVADAVVLAHGATGAATLTAALAGAAAYGCLAVGDFPLLDHFALVGALGMFLCWLSTLLLLGPALLWLERWRPEDAAGVLRPGRWRGFRVRYEQPFAFLVSRYSRPVALTGGALAVVGLVASVHYGRAWPTEQDMRRLQNDLGASSELYATSRRCADILGAAIESSMIVLADRPEQVPALKQTLEARRDAAATGEKPFEAVHTLFDFVPPDQERKLPVLASLRAMLLDIRAYLDEAEWRRIASFVPPGDLTPFGVDDLPAELAAPFTDKFGVRGRIALIEPAAGHSDSDIRYLMRWANAFRETQLPNGDIIHGSGRAVVFADVLQAVQTATPRTLALSLCMTTLVVALLFRGLRGTLLVFATLSTGLVWLGLMMSAGGVRLNFMNFIALPVTFGIAVDYPVNFLTRLRGDPQRDVLAALRGTGGAIILCSLTTLLGYTALLASVNQAIRSLGLLCVLGELACVTAATLVLPAALVWYQRTRRVRPRLEAGLRTA